MAVYRTTFMSHAHADNEECKDYAMRLRARGIDVWIDLSNLQTGHMLGEEIEKQLKAREALVYMMTPESLESFWVRMETQAYLGEMAKNPRKMMIPVRLKVCNVPPFMNAMKWIDAVGRSREEVANEIAQALLLKDGPGTAEEPPQTEWPKPNIIERDEIGIVAGLAKLGYEGWRDRRSGVKYIISPVAPIPEGKKFIMGSDKSRDKQANDNETPQVSMPLGAYEIGKYPLTVAEYGLFVEATHRAAPKSGYNNLSWEEQKKRPEHPVVNISWNDAQKYAKWLGEVTGEKWRLPSEAEWEKAARGTDGRIYPWGNEWDASKANTAEKGPHDTTPVGMYPQGASPYGVMDMAGNVWEWTNTVYKEYPYDAEDGRDNLNSINTRVLRGGSWLSNSRNARAANRVNRRLDDSNYNGGARLAVSRFAAGSK